MAKTGQDQPKRSGVDRCVVQDCFAAGVERTLNGHGGQEKRLNYLAGKLEASALSGPGKPSPHEIPQTNHANSKSGEGKQLGAEDVLAATFACDVPTARSCSTAEVGGTEPSDTASSQPGAANEALPLQDESQQARGENDVTAVLPGAGTPGSAEQDFSLRKSPPPSPSVGLLPRHCPRAHVGMPHTWSPSPQENPQLVLPWLLHGPQALCTDDEAAATLPGPGIPSVGEGLPEGDEVPGSNHAAALQEEAGGGEPAVPYSGPTDGGSIEPERPLRARHVGLDEYRKNIAEQLGASAVTNNGSSELAAPPSPPLPPPPSAPPPRRRTEGGVRYNYAAAAHGAKVVEANREAKSAGALLDEDRDKYMRTPCSADDKRVVIELSEALARIDTVVLSNYEFYSSMIRDFEVLGARQYPPDDDDDDDDDGNDDPAAPQEQEGQQGQQGKQQQQGGRGQHGGSGGGAGGGRRGWVSLGTFTALNIRTPQSFAIEAPGGAWGQPVRYVKLRLLSHHGAEFFCTLSLVRVHGVDELEALREELEAALPHAPPPPTMQKQPPPPPTPPPPLLQQQQQQVVQPAVHARSAGLHAPSDDAPAAASDAAAAAAAGGDGGGVAQRGSSPPLPGATEGGALPSPHPAAAPAAPAGESPAASMPAPAGKGTAAALLDDVPGPRTDASAGGRPQEGAAPASTGSSSSFFSSSSSEGTREPAAAAGLALAPAAAKPPAEASGSSRSANDGLEPGAAFAATFTEPSAFFEHGNGGPRAGAGGQKGDEPAPQGGQLAAGGAGGPAGSTPGGTAGLQLAGSPAPAALPTPTAIGGRSSGGGDFILKTLMNRIKALEVNQSLLGSYLEDLNHEHQAGLAGIDAELDTLLARVHNLTAAAARAAASTKLQEERLGAQIAAVQVEAMAQVATLTAHVTLLREEVDNTKKQGAAALLVALLSLLAASLLGFAASCLAPRPARDAVRPPRAGRSVAREGTPYGALFCQRAAVSVLFVGISWVSVLLIL
eukprot:jgi/Mesen1/10751/ME000903S10086